MPDERGKRMGGTPNTPGQQTWKQPNQPTNPQNEPRKENIPGRERNPQQDMPQRPEKERR